MWKAIYRLEKEIDRLVVSQYHSSHICHSYAFIHIWPPSYFGIRLRLDSGTFQLKFTIDTLNMMQKLQVFPIKANFIKMPFYQ